MKNRFTKTLCVLLATILLCSIPVSAESGAMDKPLRFNTDKKFTILQIADTQDILFPRSAMIEFLCRALDEVLPDLVVFTGDNTEDLSFFTGTWGLAMDWILAPLAARGVPFTFVFGNHDALIPAFKPLLFNHYKSYANCLAFNADCGLTGYANHNLPIYASSGDDIVFNLWMFDSNGYDLNLSHMLEGGGINLSNFGSFGDIAVAVQSIFNVPYSYVHEDQIEWFRKTNDALAAAAGHKVPSLVFQHIIVPEVAELLLPPEGNEGEPTRTLNGKACSLRLDPARAEGYLGEFPCPPFYNSGELAALAATESVLGLVVGHDHVNSFIGAVDGVDIIQTAGVSISSYGNDDVRGARVITLDESDPWSYETRTLVYADLFAGEADAAAYEFGKGIGGVLATALATLMALFGLDRIEVMRQLVGWLA